MPNWQPNWNDVRWDWGAAQQASHALRRMADILEHTAHEREQWARKATRMWWGRFRVEFDYQLDRMISGARELAAQCRELAARIDAASQWAREEQQRRIAARERWRRELEEEQRASRTSK
jgi:hypothetical protein